MANLDIVLRLGLLAKTLRAGSWFDSEAIAQDALDAADEIERLRYENEQMRKTLKSAHIVLTECANILRPTLPALAYHIIGAHLNDIDEVLERQRPG